MTDPSDQMSLSLQGDAAHLPRTLRPMQARACDAAFDSDEYVFEPRWGGRRILAFVAPEGPSGPRLRLIDEGGRDLAPRLPELAVISDLVADQPAILDGELVIPDKAGRMNDQALARRLVDGDMTDSSPVYLCFDLLWTAGRPIIAQPLQRRRELLARVVHTTTELVILPGVVGEGMDLYFAVAQQGLPGVMARHLRSPYLPGRHSDLWRWIATEPGQIPLHAVPDPVAPPAQRPVLALIQRLPLDD